MFIDDETGGRNKLDNFPKDRATLSVIRSLGGLSLDMMVVVQRAVQWLYREKRRTSVTIPGGK